MAGTPRRDRVGLSSPALVPRELRNKKATGQEALYADMANIGVSTIFFLHCHLFPAVILVVCDWSGRAAALGVKFYCSKIERRQII